MRQTYHQYRRKTGVSLLVSYLLRGGAIVLAVACVVALVWSGMYLAGFFTTTPDQSSVGSGDPTPPPNGDDPSHGGAPVSNPGSSPVSNPGSSSDPNPDSSSDLPPEPPVTVQVVIDAGHGGKDPGCSVGGAVEKDIALQLALLLQQKLEAEGITVLMTRTEDADMKMVQRVELANEAQAQLYISIHCNSFEEDARVKGLECHYWQSDESLALARTITQQVNLADIKTRDVKMSEYVVIRDTEMPAVLIETGFLTNDQDRERLTNPDSQSVLMDAVAAAVKITLNRMAE